MRQDFIFGKVVLMVEARLGFQDSNWRSKNFSWLQFYLFI